MGRWSQARRRGGRSSLGAGLGPPPPPLLTVEANYLTVTPQGDPDPGGTLLVYYSEDDLPPPNAWASHSYENPWPVCNFNELDPGYYWAQETGGGTAYSGSSDLSEPLQFE